MHRAYVECVDACVECVDACVDDASWCTRWWCIMMHALMMHHDARVDVRVNACVNAHAMQSAWMRIRCSLRKCVCDAVCVFAKSAKPAKSLLPNSNNHCRFQMIMLTKTWFKLASQLIVSSKINSLDLVDEIFCWCIKRNLLYRIRRNLLYCIEQNLLCRIRRNLLYRIGRNLLYRIKRNLLCRIK